MCVWVDGWSNHFMPLRRFEYCVDVARWCGVVVGGDARGVRAGCARASEGGGALARGWERGWERDCECVLFVTVCHCNKYAFIVVRWRRRGGVSFLHTALSFRFSDRVEPLG